MDISPERLLESAESLGRRFPELRIQAICADYSAPFRPPLEPDWGRPAAFVPGSSIGNFEPAAAVRLLNRVARMLGPGGRLLIGVGLLKERELLEAAYNEREGVSAAFNLNLLARIIRELGADFELSAFDHRAWFNPAPDPAAPDGPGRVEKHPVSRRAQEVWVDGHRFAFAEGESIHTESSYKYDIGGFGRLAVEAGFETERVWTGAARRFSVQSLRVD